MLVESRLVLFVSKKRLVVAQKGNMLGTDLKGGEVWTMPSQEQDRAMRAKSRILVDLGYVLIKLRPPLTRLPVDC